MRSIITALLLLTLCTPAAAQDAGLDEIVVTGNRAIEWDPDEVPVVQLARRADNLIVAVRVVNDTRDSADRRREIVETLRSMTRAAGSRSDIDLSIDDDGQLLPLTYEMVSTLTLGVDGSRADTSVASIIVKTPIETADTLDGASQRIESYIADVTRVGRSLVDIAGDWELSVVNPARYRRDILSLIAGDAQVVTEAFGDGYAVQIDGLSNRVTWRQSGPLELSLFIPYDMTVTPRP